MKTKKKNRFLTFCFSFLPGAAEMYMGFMKTGVSLMLVFFLLIALAGWMQQAVIVMFGVVIWFYSFFHANHLASLNDEEFVQTKDEYLLGMDGIPGIKSVIENYQKAVAFALIFIGVCFLWNSLTNILFEVLPQSYLFIARAMYRVGSYVPSVLIGVVIIMIGVKMISGKKMEIEKPDDLQAVTGTVPEKAEKEDVCAERAGEADGKGEQ